MTESTRLWLSEKEKKKFIEAITLELASLRAKACVSQEEIANFIGVSRQTYGAIERGARRMSWSTYLSVLLFFDYNSKTHEMLRNSVAFPQELFGKFSGQVAAKDICVEEVFEQDIRKMWKSLDEKAVSTIKTVMMVEYSRCSGLSDKSVIKFFEGMNFFANSVSKAQKQTRKAIESKRKSHKDN